MAILVRTEGSHEGKWVYSLGSRCVLGRHAECDISDIFAGNAGVSRFHAQLELVGNRYFIEDRGSRNGTFLNGRRLTERAPLRNNDRVAVAGVELIFLEQADAASSESGPPSPALSRVTFDEPTEPTTPLSSLAAEAPGAAGSLAGYSADKLRALLQMLQRLGRSLDIDKTLHELLAGLFAIFPQAKSGFVAFTAEGQDDITPRATYFRSDAANAGVRISRSLIRYVLARREAVLWTDQGSQQESADFQTLSAFAIRSLMCAPLLDGDGNPFAVVQIDTDEPVREFTAEDLEVMVGAASQASVAVRFAKLHEEALRRHAVERDLELARVVQLGLLPESYPHCEGFEFFAYYRAAYDVGGDYYDFIELPDDRLAIVVADAAGKGVSAALMMAKLAGELKYQLSCDLPGIALARMNDSLCAGATGRFVTLLAAILDCRSWTLTVVNAGHLVPLRRRSDGVVEAVGEAARGAALGLMPGQRYQEWQAAVEPGDLWLMYTDGFTEATSAKDEMYGSTRLRQRLSLAPGVIREAGDRIVREVQSFMSDQPQSDDMCLVGWGRLGDANERTTEPRPAETQFTKGPR